MKKIIVVGSANTDMVVSSRRLPAAGETVTGGAFLMNPGGKGANQAVAVARLSRVRKSCVFIGKVGNDVFGRDCLRQMKADGIDARLLVDEKAPSGTALILVDAKGQNMISVAPGANAALAPEDLAPFETLMKEASVVVLQLETPVESVLAAAKMAHRAGAKVILNPAPARKLPRELYGLVDYLTPNETEAEILTGVKVVDAASAQKATSILMRRGVGHVIITMGAKGCWCGACERIYPVKRVKAIDCVAAGDTFNGAFAVAVTEGLSCADAIAFAQKASAIAVTRKGAQASIPFRKELDA